MYTFALSFVLSRQYLTERRLRLYHPFRHRLVQCLKLAVARLLLIVGFDGDALSLDRRIPLPLQPPHFGQPPPLALLAGGDLAAGVVKLAVEVGKCEVNYMISNSNIGTVSAISSVMVRWRIVMRRSFAISWLARST